MGTKEMYRLDLHRNRKGEKWYTVLTPDKTWITDNGDPVQHASEALAKNAIKDHWESKEIPTVSTFVDMTESPTDAARRRGNARAEQ